MPEGIEISDIFIVNDTLIWATAMDWTLIGSPVPENQHPYVLKSTDGGETWEVFEVEEAPARASEKIHAFDDSTAWIATQSWQSADIGRGLFITTDGGATWTEKLNHVAGAGPFHFFDEQNGVAWLFDHVRTTADGGQTWEPVSNPPVFQAGEGGISYSISTSYSVIGDTIWQGTSSGRVFRSIDKGHSWTAFPTVESSNIPSLAFANASTGLLIQNDGDLSRSTDGGASWEPIDGPPGIYELTRIEGTSILVATSYEYLGEGINQTLYTDDLGESWITIDSSVQAYGPAFRLNADGTVQGWIGAIRPDADAPSLYSFEEEAIVSIKELLAKSVQVRVFPNPVVDQVTIQAEDFALESVRIMDAQGQTLAVNSTKNSSAIDMDLSRLPAGIYFLEIRTDKGAVIKKVVKK